MADVPHETTEQEPVRQVLHVHKTLPPESWGAFGQVCRVLVVDVNATIVTAVQEGPGPARVAYRELITFPSYTHCDTNDSKRRSQRLDKKLGKFLWAKKLQAPNMSRMPGKQKRVYKRKWDRGLAARLRKQLERGSMERASQCLDQAELAGPALETMQKVVELHPQADPPEWTCTKQCR